MNSHIKKMIAEAIGTFALVFVVMTAVAGGSGATPWLAGLVLGLMVYSIGHISGAHINPAVSIGAWSIGKISVRGTISYIIAQFIGAALAMWAVSAMMPGAADAIAGAVSLSAGGIFFAEMIGMFFFTFGIASVIYGKTPGNLSGVVVGLSLTLGIMIAAVASAGILNPAVAMGLRSLSLSYILAPIVGSILGMNVYKRLMTK